MIQRIYSVAILSFCLSVFLAGELFFQNINNLLESSHSEGQLTVYPKVAALELSKIKESIEKIEGIDFVKIMSSEEAVKEFKEQVASFGSMNLQISDLASLIPSTLIVQLKKDMFDHSIGEESRNELSVLKLTSAKISSLPEVESVDYGQKWTEQFREVSEVFRIIVYLVGFFIFATVGFIAYSTVQVHILQKKEEIQILELIGASPGFIRKPFLSEAIKNSIMTVVVSSISVGILFWITKDILSKNSILGSMSHRIEFLSLATWAITTVLFIAFIMLFSYWSLLKINNGWSSTSES